MMSQLLFHIAGLSVLVFVNGDHLKFVNLLFRHGDRTPINSYPNSMYRESYWKQGFGQLTQEGMREQYRLGEFLRTRYDGFLSRNYSRHQIKAISTDVDRTLMSVECTLAGLYPPEGNQVWKDSMNWQPIPVHTGDLYSYYLPNVTVCPYYYILFKKMMKGEWVKNINAEQATFFKNISKSAGYGHTLNISEVYHLADPIRVETFHNLTIPTWITDDVYQRLMTLTDNFLTYMYKQHGINRIVGGSLLEKMVENMDRKLSSTEAINKQRHVEMYSVHDTTIAALLSALDIHNGKVPPYSACVGIELWETNDKIHYINMWYKNDTNAEPHILKIPACNATECEFNEFKRLMKDVMPGDMKLACRLPFYLNSYVIVSFVAGAVMLMLLVLAVLFCRSEVRQRQRRYLIDKHDEAL